MKQSKGSHDKRNWPEYQFEHVGSDDLMLICLYGLMAFKSTDSWIPLARDFALILVEQLQEERRRDGRIIAVPMNVIIRKVRWLVIGGSTHEERVNNKLLQYAAQAIMDSLLESNYVSLASPEYVQITDMGRRRLAGHRRWVANMRPSIERMVFANTDIVHTNKTNDAREEAAAKKAISATFVRMAEDTSPLREAYLGGVPIYRRVLRKKSQRKLAKDKRKP